MIKPDFSICKNCKHCMTTIQTNINNFDDFEIRCNVDFPTVSIADGKIKTKKDKIKDVEINISKKFLKIVFTS